MAAANRRSRRVAGSAARRLNEARETGAEDSARTDATSRDGEFDDEPAHPDLGTESGESDVESLEQAGDGRDDRSTSAGVAETDATGRANVNASDSPDVDGEVASSDGPDSSIAPMDAPESPASTETGDAGGAGRAWGILAVVSVAAIAAVALAIWLGQRGAGDQGGSSHDESLIEAAKGAATAVTTVRYQDINESRSSATNYMTDEFQKDQYDTLFTAPYCDVVAASSCDETGTYTEVIERNKQDLSGEVVGVAALECDEDCGKERRVMVFVNQVTTDDGKVVGERPTQLSALLTMTNDDGKWLVDDIAQL